MRALQGLLFRQVWMGLCLVPGVMLGSMERKTGTALALGTHSLSHAHRGSEPAALGESAPTPSFTEEEPDTREETFVSAQEANVRESRDLDSNAHSELSVLILNPIQHLLENL